MKLTVKEMPMEEYAKERNKKKEITSVRVKKAKGGYIVEADEMEYGAKPSVYKDLQGVYKCLQEKFKEEE